MRELALFAGAGGGILGGKLLGWRTVCAVEIDPYCREVLLARQIDGALERFPIWDDVCTFDGNPWRGHVDVISGGFPCQDISAAGKGAGIDGERSGLWSEFARIIGEVRPRFAFVENSPILTSRGLERVLGDLAALGYDAEWGVLGAHHAGAPHRRDRIWIVAHCDLQRMEVGGEPETIANTGRVWGERGGAGGDGRRVATTDKDEYVAYAEQPRLEGGAWLGMQGEGGPSVEPAERCWWEAEPRLDRVVDGVPHRVDRLRAIGNGQVPQVAELAWRILTAPEQGEGVMENPSNFSSVRTGCFRHGAFYSSTGMCPECYRELYAELTALRAENEKLRDERDSAIGCRYRAERELGATRYDLTAERERSAKLGAGLDESVKLQSHYAMLLNGLDAGERMQFAGAQEWLDRLTALATYRHSDEPAKEEGGD